MARQLYAELDAATEAALRESIVRFGVLVPVVLDQHGEIIDGHHRSRLAGEVGVEFPKDVRHVSDEEEALELARTLNSDRRHLTPEQRKEVVAVLRQKGHSTRAIAGAVGVGKSQVAKDLAQVSTGGHVSRVNGQDGKTYPAKRANEQAAHGKGRPGKRNNKLASYNADTDRKRGLAQGQLERLRDGLSHIEGICRGLADLDYGQIAAVCHNEELATWEKAAGRLSRELARIKERVRRGAENGQNGQ